MYATPIDIDLIVNNVAISKYFDSYRNTFVEGRKGTAYAIRLTNRNPYKVKAIVSVDGKNILTGDQVWEKGYVIEPNSSLDVPGWRIDKDKVAQFVFSELKDGYNVGSGSNSGVIGVRAFKEVFTAAISPGVSVKEWDLTQTTWMDASPTNANTRTYASKGISMNSLYAPSISAEPRELNAIATGAIASEVATGWGEDKQFQTTKSEEKFEQTHYNQNAIYYDSAKGLAKRGIHVRGAGGVPDAFPDTQDFGCSPPKG
jgi:hypothetical protein